MRRAAASYVGGPARPSSRSPTAPRWASAVMYGGLDLRARRRDPDDDPRLLLDRGGAAAGRPCAPGRGSAAVTPVRRPGRRDRRRADLSGCSTRSAPAPGWSRVTWVHSSTGVRLPIAEYGAAIADLNRSRPGRTGSCSASTACTGSGRSTSTCPSLGCDFLATGTHKWLFGPRGTGIVWGRDWDPLTELIPTFSGPAAVPGSPPAATTTSSTAGRWRRRSRSTSGSAATGSRPHRRAGDRAQGGPGRRRRDHRRHAGRPGRLGRHRLRRRARACRRERRDGAARAAGSWPAPRRTGSPTSGSARASSPRPRRSTRRSPRSPSSS